MPRKLNDHAGVGAQILGISIVMVIGFYIVSMVSDSMSPVAVNTTETNVSASIDGTIYFSTVYYQATGEITELMVTDDYYLVNFKDDLSDYRFTGVDETEYNLLNKAFGSHDSVTVTYLIDGDEKNLYGVTLYSPAPPEEPVDTTDITRTSDDNYWMILPMCIGPAISLSLLFANHRRTVRTRDALVRYERSRRQPESDDTMVTIENQVTGRERKKTDEAEEKEIVPLDGRYRAEQADALLGEKNKNRKYKKEREKKERESK